MRLRSRYDRDIVNCTDEHSRNFDNKLNLDDLLRDVSVCKTLEWELLGVSGPFHILLTVIAYRIELTCSAQWKCGIPVWLKKTEQDGMKMKAYSDFLLFCLVNICIRHEDLMAQGGLYAAMWTKQQISHNLQPGTDGEN